MSWDGREQPNAADLLAIARRIVLDDLAPALTGDARFKALMAANAIAIASRETPAACTEIATAAAALGDPVALTARIRTGELDPGRPDHRDVAMALMALAMARCRVSAPKALQRAEPGRSREESRKAAIQASR